MRHDVTGSNAFAMLTESSDRNGVRVIMSNLTVSIPTSEIVLTCVNVDHTTSESVIVPAAGKYLFWSPLSPVFFI